MRTKQHCLVILTPGFPKNEDDTSCLPSQQIFVRKLNELFPELKIIVLTIDYPFFKAKYTWHNNSVTSFNAWQKNKAYKILTSVRIWRELNKIKNNYSITGILSFWYNQAAVIGNYYARKKAIKHLSWINGQDAKKDNKWVNFMKPRQQELVALSDFLAVEFHKNHHIKPLHIVSNGIDSDLFPTVPSPRDIDISGAGSLIPLKQYDLFVKIIGQLKSKFPGITAVHCGKGPEENNLKALIGNLNLENNITLRGELQHADVLKLMARSKIFLHTSNYEGFSTVCLEAVYAGAHVISFCKPMDKEINHWHIVKNEEEMIEKACFILNDIQTEYSPVMAYSMAESAKAMMNLFGYKAAATS